MQLNNSSLTNSRQQNFGATSTHRVRDFLGKQVKQAIRNNERETAHNIIKEYGKLKKSADNLFLDVKGIFNKYLVINKNDGTEVTTSQLPAKDSKDYMPRMTEGILRMVNTELAASAKIFPENSGPIAFEWWGLGVSSNSEKVIELKKSHPNVFKLLRLVKEEDGWWSSSNRLKEAIENSPKEAIENLLIRDTKKMPTVQEPLYQALFGRNENVENVAYLYGAAREGDELAKKLSEAISYRVNVDDVANLHKAASKDDELAKKLKAVIQKTDVGLDSVIKFYQGITEEDEITKKLLELGNVHREFDVIKFYEINSKCISAKELDKLEKVMQNCCADKIFYKRLSDMCWGDCVTLAKLLDRVSDEDIVSRRNIEPFLLKNNIRALLKLYRESPANVYSVISREISDKSVDRLVRRNS